MILRLCLGVLLCFTLAFGVDARFDIVKSKISASNIFVNVYSKDVHKGYLRKIKNSIKMDLKVSGYFNTIILEISKQYNKQPQDKVFGDNGIDFVLKVRVQRSPQVVFDVELIDIKSNKQIMSATYTTSDKNQYPMLVHYMSADIAKKLHRASLDWMKQKVIFSKYIKSGESQIIVSDYTLKYQKVVVSGGLKLFPKWANKEHTAFYYTSYDYFKPTLIYKNLKTNTYKRILSSNGMIVCSDVSKDGSKLLVTMAINDQTDIYLYNKKTKQKKRLTHYEGIDVSGNFIDNEKRIVFVSDRLEYPNIFAKKLNGKAVEQVVYHGKNNAQVSAYGNYIVYSSRESFNEFGVNIFNLYLISTKSDFIRRLTTTGVNQSPKISSDGKHILFIKRYRGKNYLGLIGVNDNKLFLFQSKVGKMQSMDW